VSPSIRLTVGLFLTLTAPTPAQPPTGQKTASADTAWKGGPFDRLRFRSIGPATMSGRVDDLAVLERDPRVYYIATATGGLWKTENNGVTLTPVFDSASTLVSIGDVAIAQDDPNLVWVGTGENNNRQSSSWGDGVYKSADGGKTWKNMGLRDSKQIAGVIVDPVDHDVVYVAALGDLWKAGGDRGIYKTVDGGQSWSKVLDAGPDAGGTELVMDPTNNKVLYAATYQRRRASWGFNGGGPASGIWKSTDAGRTWQRLSKGIPDGPLGRIGLDLYRTNPSIVYARIEHEKEGGVYRSDDGGASWRKMGTTNPRPMYFGIIRVDPKNDLRVYVPGTLMHVSDDGGKTFRGLDSMKIHVDFHAMWINPANPEHLLVGNDGGVGVSYDKAKTWMYLPHLPVGQFYHVSYDMQTPFNICGGLQDNNTWCGPSQVRSRDGIGNDEWFVVQGGDGFVGLVDPTNHRIIYAESQDGFLNRIDRVTNESKSIRPEAPSDQKPYRWNWDTPFVLSPHDPNTIYAGANGLFRSTDRGRSWTMIGGDLTLAMDRDTVELMGIKGKDIKLAKNDGVSVYGTLFTVAESKLKRGLLYTGSDDGQVQVSRDGASWINVTSKIPNAPRFAYVSKVEPSKFAEATVYATFDAHRTGDYGTYVYASTDYGTSWKSIVANLPPGQVARSISEDVKNPDVLYLGTETGLFVSTDRGKSWVRVKANLPTVPVYEITLHPRDNSMILATHGRAIWILDDLTPFQQATVAFGKDVHFFETRPAMHRVLAGDRMREFEGDMRFLGENPQLGAHLTYFLKIKADSARMVIRDAAGATVRELKGDDFKEKLSPGVNVAIWDLRVEPLPPSKRQQPAGGGGGFFGGGGRQGPPVLPGRYRATLVLNGKEAASREVTVGLDPDVRIADADLKARFDALTELHALNGKVTAAVEALRTADEQLIAIRKELSDSTKVPAPIRASMDSLKKELDPIKRKFGIRSPGEDFFSAGFDFNEFRRALPNRLGGTSGDILGAHEPLSETNTRTIAELKQAVPAAVADANAFLAKLPPLYKRLAEAGLYPPAPEAVK